MKNLIMKKVRKALSLFVVACFMVGAFVGCGSTQVSEAQVPGSAASDSEDSISVVTTIFPEYDWVKQVVGEVPNVDITLLLDNGVDLHSYQPTAEDIMKISSCDVFVYVGGESDEWVEEALKEAVNPNMQVINLLEVLGDSVKEEEVVEGMEAEEEEEPEEAEGEEEEVEYDEHVWLSLKNAQVLVNAIADSLAAVDSANADTYKYNAASYTASLAELDGKYEAAVSSANGKTLLFADRFPFRYLVDDYGLSYYAAFVGCSAETEASFETITFLAKKVDELDLGTVLTIENSDNKIANTVIENTNSKSASILAMDSMQSVTSKDASYLAIMESNLETLEEALK